MSFTVILAKNEYSGALLDQIHEALDGMDYQVSHTLDDAKGKLLFAVALDECGCNEGYYHMLRRLRGDPALLDGCTAGLVVTGQSELYTKSIARTLALSANMAGCAFIGRPLVEATGSLRNFYTQAGIRGTDVHTAYRLAIRELAERLEEWEGPKTIRRVAAIHASVRRTSNTLALWGMVRQHLEQMEVAEYCLLNGAVADCAGCSYTACMHFGKQGGCFYGGVMVDEVFPALRNCDALVMLCANYNDALSANLTAFVNRLTALFRQTRFYDKRLYGLVVSGYSGGDLVAQQLLSSLNMNKSFYLPPYFALLETANDAGSLIKQDGVEERTELFAKRMMQ